MPDDSAVPEDVALPPRPDRVQPITPDGYRRLVLERAALEPTRFRARVIDQILATVEVVAPGTLEDGAGFGCELELEGESGNRKTFTLVGPDEVDAAAGRISTTSPLGRALLGKSVGDSVEWKRGAREEEWTVVRINAGR